MKVRGKFAILGAVIIVISFLLPAEISMAKESKYEFAETERSYTPHGIIRINSDAEFAQIAQQEGWPGDGSESNPYIIEGYEIDAQGVGNCIYIGNTTVHFIIRNCYLHGAYYQSLL